MTHRVTVRNFQDYFGFDLPMPYEHVTKFEANCEEFTIFDPPTCCI